MGRHFITGLIEEELTVGQSLKYVSPEAFDQAVGIKRFVSTGDNPNYSVKEGMLYSADGTTLISGISEGKVSIPEGTVTIGEKAFYNRDLLEEVTIPKSLKEIEEYAFCNCDNLQEVIFTDDSDPEIIDRYAFSDCASLKEIRLPDNVTEISQGLFYGCEKLSNVSYSDELITINDDAFYGCTSLSKFTVSKNVKDISDIAFGNNIKF